MLGLSLVAWYLPWGNMVGDLEGWGCGLWIGWLTFEMHTGGEFFTLSRK